MPLSSKRSHLFLAGASTACMLLALSGGADPEVAFSAQRLQVALRYQGWTPAGIRLLLLPVPIVLAVLRAYRWDESEAVSRLSAINGAFWGLLGLRALAFWDPVGWLLPWIGILWAPHMDFALVLGLSLYLAPEGSKGEAVSPRGARWTAAALGVGAFILYAVSTLYVSQVTLLHGDEGQFLRVTQSLVHDGDLDLANQPTEATREFQPTSFPLSAAPNSPAGHVYSRHAAGLSVLLVPAYALGLELWSNPRLGSALFMALLAAVTVSLAFLWLRRLGNAAVPAIAAAVVLGTTTPLALYCHQIYPDLPGLFLLLVGLVSLSHWQRAGGSYQAMGPHEPWRLAALTLVLSTLPLFHPRLLAIAAVPAGLVLLQAWNSPRRRACLAAVGLACLPCLVALPAYNETVSGHWLGTFLPGNVWRGAGGISLGVVPRNLVLLWLDGGQGLLNSSPVFLLAPIGWGLLLCESRDRRLLLVVACYMLSAGVNALLIYWSDNYCFPGRFLIVALPPLLLGVAHALGRLQARLSLAVAASLLLAISWDGVAAALPAPELAYQGDHLPSRAIIGYYPVGVHVASAGRMGWPGDIDVWPMVLALAVGGLWLWHRRRFAYALLSLGVLALLPATMASRSAWADRLPDSLSSLRARLSEGEDAWRPAALRSRFALNRGAGGQRAANPLITTGGDTPAGMLTSRVLPVLSPGRLTVEIPEVTPCCQGSGVTGHIIITQRQRAIVRSPWEQLWSWPLRCGARAGPLTRAIDLDARGAGRVDIEHSGSGCVRLAAGFVATYEPARPRGWGRARLRLDGPVSKTSPLRYQSPTVRLPAGRYRASFELSAGPLRALFRTDLPPVALAVHAAPETATATDSQGELVWQAQAWLLLPRMARTTVPHPRFLRPLAERYQAQFWAAPLVPRGGAYDVVFELDTASRVVLLAKVDGPLCLAQVVVREATPGREASVAALTKP